VVYDGTAGKAAAAFARQQPAFPDSSKHELQAPHAHHKKMGIGTLDVMVLQYGVIFASKSTVCLESSGS
jgi:hypothetical protein